MSAINLCLLLLTVSYAYSATTAAPKASPKETVAELESEMNGDIRNHKVMLYSKTYCRFSKKIKQILGKYPIFDMKIVELDRSNQMKEMQNILDSITHRRTVPQLFIEGRFIGGCDDTEKLDEEGDLEKLLQEAHALSY